MVSQNEEADYFAVMGLTPDATEADIRKAYRKMSLALHPDKNRHLDAAEAASRFSEMQFAYEVLMDPSARLAASERRKAEAAKKERRGAYEGKRKAMAEELERREQEDRQKRFKGVQEERQRKATLEKLREEGKRLRQEREDKRREQHEEQDKLHRPANSTTDQTRQPNSPGPELGPLDLTVKIRFPMDQYLLLASDPSGTPITGIDSSLRSPLANALCSRFGPLDSLLFRTSKEKDRGEGTAHATFQSLDSAFAAVKAGSQLKAGAPGPSHVLEDVWIGWSAASKKFTPKPDNPSGMPGEPARISWMRQKGLLGTTSEELPPPPAMHKPEVNQSSSGSSFPSFPFVAASTDKSTPPPLLHSESATLQRLREAERKRVQEAIKRAEAET